MKMSPLQFLTALLLAAPLQAGGGGGSTPPALLQFQGQLLDSVGLPVNVTANVVFRIYDTPLGGLPLFEETQSLPIVEGLVSAIVGSTVPLSPALFDNDGELYLAMEISGDGEMVPRHRLASAPYALRASSARNADDVLGNDIHPSSVTVGGVPVIDSAGNWVGPASGLEGPTGPAGPAGPTGAQGAAGLDGADGAQGPAGPTGAQGAAGLDGADGAQGPAGPTGAQGAAGLDGADGAQGPAGPTGAPGAQGPAGLDGADGAQGPAGPTGAPGAQGPAGLDGADGAQGPAGPNVLDGSTTIIGDIAFPESVSAVDSGSFSVGAIDATATGPNSAALRAESTGSAGRGVYGLGSDGVYGESTSLTGTGVFGDGPALGYGVQGRNTADFGTGVLGVASGSVGPTYGLSGQSSSTEGRGVQGLSLFASGVTYGVRGEVLSPGGFGVFSVGDFGGTGAKFFVQPHPSDPGRQVRFVCLEGNESGTYFRGSSKLAEGRAVIDVPEEFQLVTDTSGLTVQVTAMGPKADLWIESQSLERIVVRGARDVEFHYFVNGVRRGFGDIELIQDNNAFVPTLRGVPFGTQYPEAVQRILIGNGILNADLTPNEETAASMGWTLRDPSPAQAPSNRESQ